MYQITTVSILVCCGFAAGAHASLSQTTTTPPGGFVQAGAYPTTCGCSPVAIGSDLQAGYGLGADFHEQAFVGTGVAAASASNNTPGTAGPLSQSMSGSAGMGFVRAQGSNAYTDEAVFANAILDGGWKESFVVNHPSLNGQNGYMVFRLHARGQLHTQGGSGAAAIVIAPYKNNVQLMNNPYFNPEGSDLLSTENQYGQWGLASYGQPDNRTVDSYVTMSVPITFGTPFSLGVFVRAMAAQRSSGGFNGPSSDWLDFSSHGVEWAGITALYTAGGAGVTGATIVSGSGIDWTPALGACDSVDFNGDGLFPDTADIDDFLTVFSGGACPTGTCGDIDFNNDGLFPDTSDIDSLLSVFSGGACV